MLRHAPDDQTPDDHSPDHKVYAERVKEEMLAIVVAQMDSQADAVATGVGVHDKVLGMNCTLQLSAGATGGSGPSLIVSRIGENANTSTLSMGWGYEKDLGSVSTARTLCR